jgi:molecular chaperone GrpE
MRCCAPINRADTANLLDHQPSMSDPQPIPQPGQLPEQPSNLGAPLSGAPSPEELEAAGAADEAEEAGALAQAQAELATQKAKASEMADQFLRAKAEAENARRRAEEEISKARRFAVEAFAQSMLPVADSLEAGLSIPDATPQQLREGAEATLRQLKSALERNKVLEINPPAGSRFDPHQHQAIGVAAAPEGAPQEPNSVVSVLQKGYSIAERVMRPALVMVTAPQ